MIVVPLAVEEWFLMREDLVAIEVPFIMEKRFLNEEAVVLDISMVFISIAIATLISSPVSQGGGRR